MIINWAYISFIGAISLAQAISYPFYPVVMQKFNEEFKNRVFKWVR